MLVVTVTVSIFVISSWACVNTASLSLLESAAFNDWQLTVAGFVTGFIDMKKGQLAVILAVRRGTLPSFVWKERHTLIIGLVPCLTYYFSFFAIAVSVAVVFDSRSTFAAADFLFLQPGSSIAACSGRTILTSSLACLKVPHLLES